MIILTKKALSRAVRKELEGEYGIESEVRDVRILIDMLMAYLGLEFVDGEKSYKTVGVRKKSKKE